MWKKLSIFACFGFAIIVIAPLRAEPVNPTALEKIEELYSQALEANSAGRHAEGLAVSELGYSSALRELPADHPLRFVLANTFAIELAEAGRLHEAEPLYREALVGYREMLGDEHEATLELIHNLAVTLNGLNRQTEAEQFFREALEGRRITLGKENFDTLRSLNSLALLLQQMDRYTEAEPLSREALHGFRVRLGNDHPNSLIALSNLAYLLVEAGRSSDAEPLYREALDRRRAALGDDHPDTLETMRSLALLLDTQGQEAEAEALYREGLTGSRAVLGNEHPETLGVMSNLGYLLQFSERFQEAEPLLREALSGKRITIGDQHPATLLNISSLAFLLEETGRYEEAVPLYREALDGYRSVLGDRHPETSKVKKRLATTLAELGESAEAEQLYRETLSGQRLSLGKLHRDTLSTVNDLATLLGDLGHYVEAEALFREALVGSRKTLGDAHPSTLISAGSYGDFLRKLGRFSEAEPLIREALLGHTELYGELHPDTLTSIGNLAALLHSTGRLAESEAVYRKTLAGSRNVSGNLHPSTLTAIDSLAALLDEIGRYDEAEPLYREALAGRRVVLGDQNPSTLASLNNLAMLLSATDRHTEAETLFREVLDGNRVALGELHPRTLSTMNNLAALLANTERYSEAEELYREALDGRRRTLGESHPDTLTSMNNLAGLFQTKRNFTEAEALYRKAVVGSRSTFGEAHPTTILFELNLVSLLGAARKFDEARGSLSRLGPLALSWVGSEIAETEQVGERRRTLQSNATYQDAAFSVALEERSVEAARLAANTALSWKRIDGEGEAALARFINESNDPAVTAAAKEVASRRAEITVALNHGADDLIARKEALEAAVARLAELSSAFASDERERRAGLAEVQSALPEDAALLEFRAFNKLDPEFSGFETRRMIGVLLRRGRDPLLADLGPLDEIATAVDKVTAEVAGDRGLTPRKNRLPSEAAAELLAKLLLEPFAEQLASAETVYLAPDGPLHSLPFDLLPFEGSEYWIEAQDIRLVSTGRVLVRQRVKTVQRGLLALGGSDFNASGSKPIEVSTFDTEQDTKADAATRSAIIDHFADLPETAPEVFEIAALWRERTGDDATTLTGDRAREAALKSAASPRVLHLATHGFYVADQEREKINPMALGGLALSGANRGLKGELDIDGQDGILWALEAMSLPLTGTELVSLSACDTAKGVSDPSEGVYGLGRAFQTAGAQNVLLTLWALNDARAKEFMVEFYAIWLSQKLADPAEALRTVKLRWLASEDRGRADPQSWAPYVIIQNGL